MLPNFYRRGAAAFAAAIVSVPLLVSADMQRRPNFIVIQPDDHIFLEEWNPPARFRIQEDIISMATDIIPASSASSTSSTSTSISSAYISPVPNINRIRNNGLEMTNAYAASTMCGTSRYSTLTGRLPSRSSYGRNIDKGLIERSIIADDETTSLFLRDVIIPKTKLEDVMGVEDPKDCTSNNIAAVLKQHGYSTGVVGKWHLDANTLSGEGLYENYPQVQEDIRRCGFDFAEAIYRENLWGSRNVNVDGNPVTHNMEHVTAEAIRFIQQAVDGNNQSGNNNENGNNRTSKPFFLYFNPTVPHSSGDVTDALLQANCKDTVQGRLSEAPFVPYGMTANIDAEGVAGCRKYRKTVLERASAAAATIGDSGEPVDDDKLAGAVWVDDAIGSLFETLEALNILNNTFVLFQLDHGMDAKGTLFEGGSRIVQFVHYPDQIKVDVSEEPSRQQQGWKFEGLVSTIDVAPTLMSLAGVPLTPPATEGADDGNGSVDEKHRYDMDGKSWFSDVVAANIGQDKQSNSFQQKEQQKIYSRKTNMNYFEERCIFVEQGLDRSVRCGCYKYIYISDLTKGFTVRAAREQGVNLDTHNVYYLCDENTDYIISPERSPELWSISSNTTVVSGKRISNDLQTKLKNKIACLLKQTNPSNKYPDYETQCDLPLHNDEFGSSIVENDPSSVGISESIIIEDVVSSEAPIESPSGDSPTFLGSNQPTSLDTTITYDGSEADTFGEEGATPFLRSPSSPSTASLITGSMPKYAIVIASLILVVAPCFIYWMYREFCRRVVVGARADRYRSEANQVTPVKVDDSDARGGKAPGPMEKIEKELLQAAITTKNTISGDLEVGSTIIRKTGLQIHTEFGSDCPRKYHPSIWQKLGDEAKRQALLRAKWCVYTVSGVVLEKSTSSVGTVLTSGTIEPAPGPLLESDHQHSEEEMEKHHNKIREGHPNEHTDVPNFMEDDENSTLEEETNKEESDDASWIQVLNGKDINEDMQEEGNGDGKEVQKKNIDEGEEKDEDRNGKENPSGGETKKQNENSNGNGNIDETKR